MKINMFIGFSLLSCVLGQFLFFSGNTIRGRYDGYQFEYHKSHRLLLVMNNMNCFLIVTDDVLETAIQTGGNSDRIKHEVTAQIKAGTGLSDATKDDIKHDFHDYLAATQCSTQTIHKLDYKFRPATTPSVQTTVTDAVTTSPTLTDVVTTAPTTVTDVITQTQTTVTETEATVTEAVTTVPTMVTDAFTQ